MGMASTGLYYHISKRAAGIRYVFIGKPSNQRPRYGVSYVKVKYVMHLCVKAYGIMCMIVVP